MSSPECYNVFLCAEETGYCICIQGHVVFMENVLDVKTLQIIGCIAQVRQDRQETLVLQGSRVILAGLDLPVLPVPLAQREQLVDKDCQDEDLADLLDRLDLLDLKDTSERTGTTV